MFEILQDNISYLIRGDNYLVFKLFLSFLGGILTSLTPCVYPMIPIVLATFDRDKDSLIKSRGERLFLGFIYISGIVIVFSSLGIVVAKTGQMMGVLLAQPIFIIILFVVLILLGFSSLGVLRIPLFDTLQSKAGGVSKRGVLGVFIMGALSGVVAAPCVGPILLAILVLAANQQSIISGFLLLLFYSLGFSLLFFILAIFRMSYVILPRSGRWLNWMKSLISVFIFSLAFYFVLPLLGTGINFYKNLSFLVIFLVCLALFFRRDSLIFLVIFNLFLSLFIAYGILNIDSYNNVEISNSSDVKGVVWLSDLSRGLELAQKEGKRVLVDFSASWCGSCKEYELNVFSNSKVQQSLKKYILVRIDLTVLDEEKNQLLARFNIPGLPAIIILNEQGQALKKILGYYPADQFLKKI